jgi:hypothetical protein
MSIVSNAAVQSLPAYNPVDPTHFTDLASYGTLRLLGPPYLLG